MVPSGPGSRAIPKDIAQEIEKIRKHAQGYGLDFFETIFEMVDYDEMNSLAASGGFPVRYPHWRFGMDYDQLQKGHTWGLQKIYEMVINTDPSYAYLLTSNSLVEQKTVIAHVYGHVDFFKNNAWFSKTNRRMLDKMANHAVKIRSLMDRLGQDAVEGWIDHCLAVENLIDPYLPFQSEKNPREVEGHPQQEEVPKLRVHRPYMESFINPKEFVEEQKKKQEEQKKQDKKNPSAPLKDVLQFLLENAPLETWEQDVLSVIREEAYYFAPQMQTKIMNEGWASYWHSRIMTEKALKDSEVVDFACQHSGTMATAPGRINPYKLGIELFRDIEDRWNRGKFGKEWDECDDLQIKAKWSKDLGLGREKIFEVRRVCNDITFIDSYLTEEFVERYKMYTYEFNRRTNQYEIADRDFKRVKEKLLLGLTNMGQPLIFVHDGNFENRGELLLGHKHQGVDLDLQWAKETLRSITHLWRRPANIMTWVEGQKKLLICSEKGEFSEKNL